MFIPTDDGRWVSEGFERLARLIKEYEPKLELRWIPPEHRTRDDKKPYVVFDTTINEPVLHASELDTPEDILGRIIAADNYHGDVLVNLEAHNLAVKMLQQQQWLDKLEELGSQAAFLMGSPLHTVRFNGKKLDHQRRPILP